MTYLDSLGVTWGAFVDEINSDQVVKIDSVILACKVSLSRGGNYRGKFYPRISYHFYNCSDLPSRIDQSKYDTCVLLYRGLSNHLNNASPITLANWFLDYHISIDFKLVLFSNTEGLLNTSNNTILINFQGSINFMTFLCDIFLKGNKAILVWFAWKCSSYFLFNIPSTMTNSPFIHIAIDHLATHSLNLKVLLEPVELHFGFTYYYSSPVFHDRNNLIP